MGVLVRVSTAGTGERYYYNDVQGLTKNIESQCDRRCGRYSMVVRMRRARRIRGSSYKDYFSCLAMRQRRHNNALTLAKAAAGCGTIVRFRGRSASPGDDNRNNLQLGLAIVFGLLSKSWLQCNLLQAETIQTDPVSCCQSSLAVFTAQPPLPASAASKNSGEMGAHGRITALRVDR